MAFARTYTVTTAASQPAIQVELRGCARPPAIAALELLAPPSEPIDLPGTWTDPVGRAPRLGEHGLLVRRLPLPGRRPDLRQYNQVVATTQHDRYDPRTGVWTSLRPPEAVDHLQAVTHQGSPLVPRRDDRWPGHRRGPRTSGQVVSYDPATGELTSHVPMPGQRGAGGIAVVDGRIYYFGGLVSPDQTSAQADVYDIATDTWTQLPDLPVAKDHFKAARDRHRHPPARVVGRHRGIVDDPPRRLRHGHRHLPLRRRAARPDGRFRASRCSTGRCSSPAARPGPRRGPARRVRLRPGGRLLDRARAAAHRPPRARPRRVRQRASYVPAAWDTSAPTNVHDTVEVVHARRLGPRLPAYRTARGRRPYRRAERAGACQLPEIRRTAAPGRARRGAGLFCTI